MKAGRKYKVGVDAKTGAVPETATEKKSRLKPVPAESLPPLITLRIGFR